MSGVSCNTCDAGSAAGTSDIGFVEVAPAPGGSGLHRLHDRMRRGVGMRSGVPPRRRIATADVPAGQAQPKMQPRRVQAEAFLAAVRGARAHLTDRRLVRVGEY